ncbi:hypothetical protein H6F93_07415 [Leptolyngbya sp. FACHB-671]|uniref:hypothetical protein n=1 Tax=Leptolyngbya sp. FACHB-671 TaxID=2692812 RepID=UPI001688456D|nr:hypothetical protein [Leptolyngbya sp. FACHB-671]MBD2067358.1 hypothetical protein [Leptolyngbya sp. FACHB-671]
MTDHSEGDRPTSVCHCRSNQLSNFVLDWFTIFHPWDFIAAQATGGKPDWRTESRFPLSPETLCKRWAEADELVGVRFKCGRGGTTRYVMFDIDITSCYHPYKNAQAFRNLLEVMESLGLCRFLTIRSSYSEGLHVYFPISESVPCFKLAAAVANAVGDAGFGVKDGQLEIFPNVKFPRSLYKAHRLPLQQGSYVLDENFQPVHDSVELLIKAWHEAELQQDLELLKQAIAVVKAHTFYASGNATEWRERLEATLKNGWTSEGQTNRILKEACIYARVFQAKDWDEIESWAVATLPSLPGYQQFCNHKRNIKRRVKDWVTTNRRSNRYRPYESRSKEPKTPLAPPNHVRSSDALQRIKDAIAQLTKQFGGLPEKVRDRQSLICKTAKCSPITLRKYLELWHPNFWGERYVTDQPTGVPAIVEQHFADAKVDASEPPDQAGYVTDESKEVSAIADDSSDLQGSTEKLASQAVTDLPLLSVNRQLGLDSSLDIAVPVSQKALNCKQGTNREKPTIKVCDQTFERKQAIEDLSLYQAIAVHSIVKRRSDNALFKVKQINSNGTAWLKWLNQYVLLVDICLPLTEIEQYESNRVT